MEIKTRTCIKCNRNLPKTDFYEEKNICKSCYKRWIRRKARIEKGKSIRTVGDLIKELSSLPYDSKIVLCTDIGFYQPSIVEYVREIYKDNKKFDIDKYENTIVID